MKSGRQSTIPEQLRIGSQSRKRQKTIQQKQGVQKLRRFEVETTSKNPCGELIDILSILKVEPCQNLHLKSMSYLPRGFAFQNLCYFDELSSWNFDVQPMANRRGCVHWVFSNNLHDALRNIDDSQFHIPKLNPLKSTFQKQSTIAGDEIKVNVTLANKYKARPENFISSNFYFPVSCLLYIVCCNNSTFAFLFSFFPL